MHTRSCSGPILPISLDSPDSGKSLQSESHQIRSQRDTEALWL
uniref:Uncharacterized protein n=1 Tax=Arundo donax TaxID=35708 RepID=A0A0A9GIB3_ARUDO